MDSTEEYNRLLAELKSEKEKSIRQQILLESIDMIDSQKLGFPKDRRTLFEESRGALFYATTPKLGNNQTPHLGVDMESIAPKFSYTEKQAIQRECFRIANQRICQPVISKMSSIRAEAEPFNVFDIEATKQKLFELDTERRQGKHQLLETEMQKFKLLEQAVQIRTDALQCNEIEVILREAELAEVKALSMSTMLLEPLGQRSAVEAIKKIEGFMDEKLREIDDKLKKQ